ncbi:MAG: hypothetical protein CBB71_18565 [Rhodopirellula sp. TMED11]|nr:MAG: hypothetical protein CBB71_18565 [Rhodopirellula sp. TMED11]
MQRATSQVQWPADGIKPRENNSGSAPVKQSFWDSHTGRSHSQAISQQIHQRGLANESVGPKNSQPSTCFAGGLTFLHNSQDRW